VIGSLIEDAASLGGLARSCEIFNVSQLVLGERGAYHVSYLAAASCLVLQHFVSGTFLIEGFCLARSIAGADSSGPLDPYEAAVHQHLCHGWPMGAPRFRPCHRSAYVPERGPPKRLHCGRRCSSRCVGHYLTGVLIRIRVFLCLDGCLCVCNRDGTRVAARSPLVLTLNVATAWP